MSRRPSASLVANPVLVGAVTTLVVIIAVFLSYNANNGLPFVPTREIKVVLPSGANLVKGNEVREGGFRIGVVTEIKPIPLSGTDRADTARPSGAQPSIGAQLTLKLDKKVGDIPSDTHIKIRPRSALGLKYVEFTRGRSRTYLKDGDTIPLDQTIVPVQFDDIYKMFDKPTRDASQQNLEGFGDAFTARGTDLNVAIEALPRLFRFLQPVMHNLADPRTDLKDFFKELGDAARVVAPVAKQNAQLFADMATTFEAFSRDPQALKDTISKSPPTLDVSTRSLKVQRPFLEDTADFSRDLNIATRELRAALPDLNPALEIGTPVVRRSVRLNEKLEGALKALRDLTSTPTTPIALRGLSTTVDTLNPQLRYVGPFITVCNYWNFFWTFNAGHFNERDTTGSAERALLNTASHAHNGIGAQGANTPANGEPDPADPEATPEYAHGQPYGAAINPDGTADCESVQRGYPRRLTGAPPNFNIASDPHTPGSQGPVFDSLDDFLKKPQSQRKLGPSRVPPGETFTREPQTGASIAP